MPAPHLSRIKSRSNSASAPSTASIKLPCGVVVSAQLSLSDLKPAPRSAIATITLSRSRVDLASRSSRVTTSTSPGSSRPIAFTSSGRSVLAPDIFSLNTRNNALGASIKLRRNGLSQRGYLRDLHAQSCLEIPLGFARAKASLATQMRTAPCGHPRSRQRETDLAQSEQRKLSPPQSVGLQPRARARGGRRLPSHSTRPGRLQSSAVGLAMRGRGCSVPPFE